MSCTDQSGEVRPEQIQERKEGIRWQMERESFFLSGECCWSFVFYAVPPYHSPVCS